MRDHPKFSEEYGTFFFYQKVPAPKCYTAPPRSQLLPTAAAESAGWQESQDPTCSQPRRQQPTDTHTKCVKEIITC